MQNKNPRSLESRLKTRHLISFLILCIMILLLIIDFIRGGITRSIFSSDVSSLSNSIESLGIIGPLAFVLLVVIEVMLAPIPGFIFYVTGAVIFGWFYGGILTVLGNMIGATLAFYLAKYLGRDYVEKKVKKQKKLEQFDRYAHKYGAYAMFFLRINPFTSSDLFSYLAGFSRMRFRSFFFGTLFGLLPLSFAQTYFGKNLVDASPALFWIFLAISIGYFVVAIYFVYINWFKGRNN